MQEHFIDAKQQGDFSRADEQRSLQWCIERYAPQTAGEFEELASEVTQNPSDGEVDVLFDPQANQPPVE